MFKAILAFIKAHTVATAITTTVVVSTVVATPIIINQVEKPKQEMENTQIIENIVDNTEINETLEGNIIENVVQEENVIENTTAEKQEQENVKNNVTDTPNTETNKNTSSSTQETPSLTQPDQVPEKPQSNQGTWVKYQIDDWAFIEVNSTTKKVKPYGCYGNVVNEEEYSYSELKSLIIPEIRNQYQEWLERNIQEDNRYWQNWGVPLENEIKGYEKELEKLDRFEDYLLTSGIEHSLIETVQFEGSNYLPHPDWINTYKQQVKDFISTTEDKLAEKEKEKHSQENYIREKMIIVEANIQKLLSSI